MIALVSGSRDYRNAREVGDCLRQLAAIGLELIVTGVDKGPERFACDWAEANGVEAEGYFDVNQLDVNARRARNERMFEEHDIDRVILFGSGPEVDALARMAGERGIPCQIVFH